VTPKMMMMMMMMMVDVIQGMVVKSCLLDISKLRGIWNEDFKAEICENYSQCMEYVKILPYTS
jgi:hypothetical protein